MFFLSWLDDKSIKPVFAQQLSGWHIDLYNEIKTNRGLLKMMCNIAVWTDIALNQTALAVK